MLELPDVTLCAIDCVNPVPALRALEISMSQCAFGDVVFLSDTAEQYQLPGCRMVAIDRLSSRAEYSRFVVKELGRHFRTRHVLVIQWDGYVVNAAAWRPEFLEFDYIGAPWGFHNDAHRVGNGGFSLRSRRLLDALQDSEINDLDPEDEAICRRYRTLLETRHHIRFADEVLAAKFSFETTYFKEMPFGFHGLFNMWMFIPPQQLAEFVSLLTPGTVSGKQFLRLGKNYLDLQRREEAQIVLRRRLSVVPDDQDAQRLLAQASPPAATAATAPGRNAPCPCGSGKRYKHCCGMAQGVTPPVAASVPNAASLLQAAMGHHQAGRLADAEALYRRVIDVEPNNALARQYLGVLRMQHGDPVGGEAQIRAAIADRPDVPDFHNNLGLCLRMQGRLEEALAAYRQAVSLNRDYAPGYNNLGLDLQALGRVEEARTEFERAIGLQPDFAEAHWNLGLALLSLGELERGWLEYEWRLRCQSFAGDGLHRSGIDPWRGEPLAGRTILVCREQGAGDTFQFLRFVPELLRRDARVVLDVSPELADLALGAVPQATLVDWTSQAKVADYYVNLMSLPHWLGVRLENLPASVPYLHPSPERISAWRNRVSAHSSLRVGVVWAGNPRHANDRNRSCPLTALEPLLSTPGVTWFSLQKGDAAAALGKLVPGTMVDLGPELATFADTAAALTSLDLLITVDTSVAHLAGALGRPVWLLLPYAPDWRWLLARTDSPWYPSLRIFRQPNIGNWGAIVEQVGRELAGYQCHQPE